MRKTTKNVGLDCWSLGIILAQNPPKKGSVLPTNVIRSPQQYVPTGISTKGTYDVLFLFSGARHVSCLS